MIVALLLSLSPVTFAYQSEDVASPFFELEQIHHTRWTHGGDLADFDSITGAAINLLDYIRANTVEPDMGAIPKYNRLQHFGGWVYQNAKNRCRDTRADVLERDADPNEPITYRDKDECRVDRGLWHDPYTGNDYKTAASLQIDHVVPLKGAWISGAHEWTPERRCHFANFMKNEYHLRAVNGSENMSKSDKGPDAYMPPNDDYKCTYLNAWMKIKMIWNLTVSRRELAAIERSLRQEGCSRTDTQINDAELKRQRQLTNETIAECKDAGDNRVRLANAVGQ